MWIYSLFLRICPTTLSFSSPTYCPLHGMPMSWQKPGRTTRLQFGVVVRVKTYLLPSNHMTCITCHHHLWIEAGCIDITINGTFLVCFAGFRDSYTSDFFLQSGPPWICMPLILIAHFLYSHTFWYVELDNQTTPKADVNLTKDRLHLNLTFCGLYFLVFTVGILAGHCAFASGA